MLDVVDSPHAFNGDFIGNRDRAGADHSVSLHIASPPEAIVRKDRFLTTCRYGLTPLDEFL